MSFSYEERLAESPFVRAVWRTHSESAGCYTASADGSWDILVIKAGGETQLFLAGPGTKAAPILYKEGSEYLGIRFRVGAFISELPPSTLVDAMTVLPKATQCSFWLGDVAWPVPSFADVEGFVEGLERHGLIALDPLVEAVLADRELALSKRSVQRRFLQTTGLTFNCLRQIERAQTAADLLGCGVSVQSTVHILGYTDQPHLTKSLRRFIGQTPAQIAWLGAK